jgi:hypothetical protein
MLLYNYLRIDTSQSFILLKTISLQLAASTPASSGLNRI